MWPKKKFRRVMLTGMNILFGMPNDSLPEQVKKYGERLEKESKQQKDSGGSAEKASDQKRIQGLMEKAFACCKKGSAG